MTRTTTPAAPLTWNIYARQSLDNADGIERQVEDCTREVERQGGVVGRVYINNDQSAHSRRKGRADYRPAYRQLMASVAAGGIRGFVAQDQDRLMRDIRESEDLIDLIERTGCRVAFVRSGGMLDLSRPDGRGNLRMKAVWAKQETEQKAERERRAAEGNARKGRLPKRRAFGYRQDGTVDPAESAMVLDAFDRLLRGETLTKICTMMNASGLTTTRGKQWAPNSLRVVLRNPRYARLRTYKGEVVAEGCWDALISAETHERAVQMLNDPTRRTTGPGGGSRRHLGGGLYWCGACEAADGQLRQHVEVATRSAPGAAKRAYVCRQRWHVSRALDAVDLLVTIAVQERLARGDAADLLAGSSPELPR